MNIDPKLHRIVAAQPYPLLFATISGAHLYGFPSPDSDFDLRGVHVLPLKEVVGLETKDETVEDARVIEGMEMDIVSHDVRKFFGLLLRKNGYVLEQLFSPLIVQTSPEHEELKAICCPSYRPGRSSASLRGEAGNASSPRPSPSEPKFGLQTEEREKNVRAGSESGAIAGSIRAERMLGAPTEGQSLLTSAATGRREERAQESGGRRWMRAISWALRARHVLGHFSGSPQVRTSSAIAAM